MPQLPSKKDVLLGLLEKTSVLVHLDARREDVQVPKHLKSNAQLILQLGLDLPVPIRDLDVSDEGVSCTLSFQRTPFFCVLPYPAIFAMVSEDGGKAMVWPEDVPVEVARAAEAEARKLGLIKSDKSTDGSPRDVSPAPAATKKKSDDKPIEAKRSAPKPKVAAREPQKRDETSASQGAQQGGRAKRELPPYLRVIK